MGREPLGTFVDKDPVFEVREGIMHVNCGDMHVCMALRMFRSSLGKANRAIDVWEEAQAGVVTPLRKR